MGTGSWPLGFQSKERWSKGIWEVALPLPGRANSYMVPKAGATGKLVRAVSVRTTPISVGLPSASAATKLRAEPLPTYTVGP